MIEAYILWACLGGFVIFHGLRVLQDITNIFSPALIISLLVFGTLVQSYFEFDATDLEALLDFDYYIITMMYAALCLLFFSFFYEKGLRSKKRVRRQPDLIDKLPSGLITLYITAIAIVGLTAQVIFAAKSGGLVAFYSQSHGAAGYYEETSAYLYSLPNFLWPALLMSYVLWIRGGHRSHYLLLLTIVIGGALFANTFLFGNRNGIIRFSIILGGVYVFIHRPSFAKAIPLIAMLSVAIVSVLVIPHIRANLHLGSEVSISQALQEYFEQNEWRGGKTQISTEAGGHELFFNVAVVQGASETGTYGYGAQYIYPILNFVPRGVWSDKPYQNDFGVDLFMLTRNVAGWDPGAGSAISAVGHSFVAFSWFGVMAWGIVAYYCGKAFRAARDAPTLMNLGFLIASLLAIVYWGTQSFSAFFFAWFFTIAPFYGLRIIARFYRPMGRRRKAMNPDGILRSKNVQRR